MSATNPDILEEWYTSQPTDFMRRGNCQGMDVNLFFPYKGENVKEALTICNGRPAKQGLAAKPVCPVRDECLAYAMALPSMCAGIWGGKSQSQRRLLRRNLLAQAEQIANEVQPGDNQALAQLVRLVSKVNRGEL